MNKLKKITDPKKYSWIINAILFNITKILPLRKKNLWVFGAREGHNYDDNSRYFFEYINKNHSEEINAIWIARDKKVVDRVRRLGYSAFQSNSFKGIHTQLRAGVSLYTNGLIDFGLFPLIGGSKIIALWHGVSCKKLYNATYSARSRKIKEFLDNFFSWTHRDITLGTSEYTLKEFSDWFSLKSSAKMFITGQPRNDVFKDGLSKDLVLKKIGIDYSKQVILYMPTYRGIAMGENAMTNIVMDLYNCSELNMALDNTNSIFIVKLHPLTPHINIKNRDNFYILDYNDVDSNQELLGIGDMIITDYSSTCTDFAILNKPVIFYTPDHDSFLEQSEPIYKEWFDIIEKCGSTTPIELARIIERPSLTATVAINDLFEDKSIRNTCYSENVYNVIYRELFH